MKTRNELAVFKASINGNLSLPVGFAEVLEIVHVAACGWVLSIHSLSFLGISDLDEIPMILNHKFSSIKMFSSNYSSPFAIDVINLLSWKGNTFSFPSWFTSLQIRWLLGNGSSLKKCCKREFVCIADKAVEAQCMALWKKCRMSLGHTLSYWVVGHSLPIKELRSAFL